MITAFFPHYPMRTEINKCKIELLKSLHPKIFKFYAWYTSPDLCLVENSLAAHQSKAFSSKELSCNYLFLILDLFQECKKFLGYWCNSETMTRQGHAWLFGFAVNMFFRRFFVTVSISEADSRFPRDILSCIFLY
jgi:hypothetical protein